MKTRKKKDNPRCVMVTVRLTRDEERQVNKRWRIRGRGDRSQVMRRLLLCGSLK